MKIKFLRDELYESEGRNQGPSFAKGEVIACTADFGERWIRRGAAEAAGKGEPKEGEVFTRVKGSAATSDDDAAPAKAAGSELDLTPKP